MEKQPYSKPTVREISTTEAVEMFKKIAANGILEERQRCINIVKNYRALDHTLANQIIKALEAP